jgi:hypothetical protein
VCSTACIWAFTVLGPWVVPWQQELGLPGPYVYLTDTALAVYDWSQCMLLQCQQRT